MLEPSFVCSDMKLATTALAGTKNYDEQLGEFYDVAYLDNPAYPVSGRSCELLLSNHASATAHEVSELQAQCLISVLYRPPPVMTDGCGSHCGMWLLAENSWGR